jgi:lipopolysaccharide transport system ATP-binding protein
MDDAKHLVLSTKVLGQDIERLDSSGRSVCTVLRLPVEPGRYLINTEIKQNGVLADQVKGAALVDVLPGDFYGTGRMWPYGGFLCDYAWRHELSS